MSEQPQRAPRSTTFQRAVLAVALIAIALGCAARFDRLGSRLLWQDEAFSMLRITGHTEAELYGAFDGRVRPVASFLALDRLAPGRGLGATFASLAEEPQRGPAFYVAARIWAGLVGDGTGAMRVLPALLGVLGIALAFLLGRELAPNGGVVLAALVAVSPVEVRFSAQLREYVAIADAALLASWLLLVALRSGGAGRWVAYGATVLAGLFISPIFLTVLLAHLAVVAGDVRRRGVRAAVPWLVASAIPVAAFAPWFVQSLIASRAHAGDLAWLRGGYGAKAYATKWLFNVGAVFYDAEFARTALGVLLAPIVAIVAVAYARLFGPGRDPRPALLAAGLTCCALVPLVVLDALGHSHVEAVARYQMTTWLGVDVAVTLLLERGLAARGERERALAVAGFGFLLACGAFSWAVARSSPIWWDDNEHLDERLAGAVVAGPKPALVVATDAADRASYALVLAHYLPATTDVLLISGAPPPLPAGFARTYLFLPTPDELAVVRGRLDAGAELVDVSPPLGMALPSLNVRAAGDGDATIRPDDLLWRVVPGASASRAVGSAAF